MPARVRTRVGAGTTMEGTRTQAPRHSQQTGRQIGCAAVMRPSQRPDILSRSQLFPKFSVTTAEEGRDWGGSWAVLVSLFFDRGESRVALGRRSTSRTATGRDRRVLRALSSACSRAGTRHDAFAGKLRPAFADC